MTDARPTPRRVLLHVGTPKSGTTYVQDVLFGNREALAAAGILYPAERHDEHFLAALDLMRLPWGGLEAEAVGAWDRLAERVRRHEGTAIISHEILATASRPQVRRALESLGHGGPDAPEVHVVLSVRDLARQLPAEWQENVKHRRWFGYARFLEEVRDPERRTEVASWFWGVQEVPWVLDRWAADLPPEHVHLVTVPPPGNPPEVLWGRFRRALGLEGVDLDLDGASSNPSLGVPETALLRRVNRRVHRRLPSEHYRPLVRELLAHRTLSRRRDSPRLGLPPDLRPWVAQVSRSWAEEVRARGWDVVGDLADLTDLPSVPWADPDRPRQADVAGAAVEAIDALLLDSAGLLDETDRLRREIDETREALDRAYLRRTRTGRRLTRAARLARRARSASTGRRRTGSLPS